jgi:hypothetical protein
VDRHAGYAASVSMREELLQDLIRVLYHGGQIPHRLAGSALGASADLFLDKPVVSCSPASGNRLSLALQAWGPLTVTPPGSTPVTRTVLMRMQVLAPPLLALDGLTLTFRLDGPASELTSLDVDALVGGPYPPAAQALIESEAFAGAVQALIQSVLGGLERVAPPLDLSFLGPIVAAPGATVTSRVVDGAIAIGIDVTNAAGVTTHGNPNLLTDTTAGNDVGMWTNPAALPVTLSSVRTKIEEQVAKQDATLDSLSFTVEEGRLGIGGSASKGNLGSVDFSLGVVPHLVRPGHCEEWDEEYGEHFVMCTPERQELWFEIVGVEVDVDRPWWVVVLDGLGILLTFGIGTLIIESYVSMIRNNVGAGISGSGGGAGADRVREFTFAGIAEPRFRLTITQYDCHVEGIYTGLTLRPQIPVPSITGPSFVGVEEAMATTLRYRVKLPFDSLADDPQLSVRWTVRRADTNAVLLTSDRPALLNPAVDITRIPELLEAPAFEIACRVYHTDGPITTDLFNGTATLRVTDRLDRTHPFVRWDHTCYAPIVMVEADGSHTEHGFDLKHRHSKIHRTAVPGRCRMVSRYSYTVSPVETNPLFPQLEYLDELPFPVEELVSKRRFVCDYCFFGGPTKTDPLI